MDWRNLLDWNLDLQTGREFVMAPPCQILRWCPTSRVSGQALRKRVIFENRMARNGSAMLITITVIISTPSSL